MDARFALVKVLIWDFDGTLYPLNTALRRDIREAEYRVIMDHTGWSHQKTEEEFTTLHKKAHPSGTETAAILTHIPTSQAALEMEHFYDRKKYLQRDAQIAALFEKLASFRHFMLANGVRHTIEATLLHIGLAPTTFEQIITSEVVGVNKPNDKGFRYIMNLTGLSPDAHMMIGDREAVDLVPAKNLGMKTCLVWSHQPSSFADITLPTVYDLESVLA